ncbi:MAG: hypothetical protein K2X97_19225, partial [Mycobacteriaceae bacterium]|nr:hypothetical protein [Mycobacteriaceae bacterium]
PVTVADMSDLPPDVVVALRTGKLPPGAMGLVEEATDQTAEASNSRSEDEERFRALYRQMVDERITDWLDEHPYCGNALPPDERNVLRTTAITTCNASGRHI